MSFGGGYGNLPDQPGGRFEPQVDQVEDEADQTFEFRRLTPDQLGRPAGRTVPPRAGAGPTWDIQLPPGRRPPGRRPPWIWPLTAAIAALAVAGIVVLLRAPFSGSPRQDNSAGRHTAALARHTAPPSHQPANTNPAPGGSADCPVGTSPGALSIANALARDPVYSDRGPALLTAAQARRLRAEIGRYDPGRIRIAAVRPGTARRGGGVRVLANAVASCPADGPGTTLVTTTTAAYVVTSYAAYAEASQAVAAALNTHATLAGGLADAIRRITTVDKSSH